MKITDLFYVYSGNKLDYGKQILNDKGVNFVSRDSNNNGVVGRVLVDENTHIYEKGNITVTLGGSYLLSSFVQEEDFVTAQNVAVLKPKDLSMSNIEKWFYCYALKANRFKFTAFGREVNKYLKYMELPDEIPEWVYQKKLIPIKTENTLKNEEIDKINWKEFRLNDLFNISAGKYHYSYEYEEGDTPYVSATINNNGIANKIDLPPDFPGNLITTEKIKCHAFYQPNPFCATSDINIFKPKFEMNQNIALFIVTVINFNESFRWSYGRQCRVGDSKKIKIKLPAKVENDDNYIPDWSYMEKFMSKLEYADNLEKIKT